MSPHAGKLGVFAGPEARPESTATGPSRLESKYWGGEIVIMPFATDPYPVDQLDFWMTADEWNGDEEFPRPLGVIDHGEAPEADVQGTGGNAMAKPAPAAIPKNAVIIYTVASRPRRLGAMIKGIDRLLDPFGISPRMEHTYRIIRRSPTEAMAADWALVCLDLARAFYQLRGKRHGAKPRSQVTSRSPNGR